MNSCVDVDASGNFAQQFLMSLNGPLEKLFCHKIFEKAYVHF